MSKSHIPPPLLDATVRFDNLPQVGRDVHVLATPDQREAVANELKISGLDYLSADLTAKPFRGGIRIEGKVVADTIQPCVVTLDPVKQHIEEQVDRIVMQGREAGVAATPGSEVFIDLEGDDLPDYYDGPEVDLSQIICESIALALDPYPRAEGASLEGLPINEADGEESPFAALKRLTEKGQG